MLQPWPSSLFFFSWKHPQVSISQHAPFSLAVATSQCEASVSTHRSLPAVGLSKLRNGIGKLPGQIFDLTESPGAVGWALKLFCPHSPVWDSDRRLSHPSAQNRCSLVQIIVEQFCWDGRAALCAQTRRFPPRRAVPSGYTVWRCPWHPAVAAGQGDPRGGEVSKGLGPSSLRVPTQ